MMLESAKILRKLFLLSWHQSHRAISLRKKMLNLLKYIKVRENGTIDVTTSLSPLKTLSAFVLAAGISSSNGTWKVWHQGDVLVKTRGDKEKSRERTKQRNVHIPNNRSCSAAISARIRGVVQFDSQYSVSPFFLCAQGQYLRLLLWYNL